MLICSLTPEEPLQKKTSSVRKIHPRKCWSRSDPNSIKQSSVTTHVTDERVGNPADTKIESHSACHCGVDFKIQNASKVLEADCG